MIPKETNFTKQENNTSTDNTKAPSNSTTSSWSRLKDPRIVRVSRAFGGKDRHSKVCTVRGLRDRRVRLSVPTAIQLYDLQDRLGLNQPSKVVDWLLNAAKHEIDELPPLQIPQGISFSQDPMTINTSHEFGACSDQSDKQGVKTDTFELKFKNDLGQTSDDQATWARNQEERQYVSSDNFSYNSFVRWDPSNLSLSHHPPRSHGLTEDWQNFNLVSLQPTLSVNPSGSHHQVLVYQPAGISTQSYYFHSQNDETNSEFDPKQVNFQTTSSSSTQSAVRPIHFNNMSTANLLPSQENDGS